MVHIYTIQRISRALRRLGLLDEKRYNGLPLLSCSLPAVIVISILSAFLLTLPATGKRLKPYDPLSPSKEIAHTTIAVYTPHEVTAIFLVLMVLIFTILFYRYMKTARRFYLYNFGKPVNAQVIKIDRSWKILNAFPYAVSRVGPAGYKDFHWRVYYRYEVAGKVFFGSDRYRDFCFIKEAPPTILGIIFPALDPQRVRQGYTYVPVAPPLEKVIIFYCRLHPQKSMIVQESYDHLYVRKGD